MKLVILIESMGGRIVSKAQATHFIVSNNRLSLLKDEIRDNWKIQHKVNLKYIFHCFFFMTKLNEQDEEYANLF